MDENILKIKSQTKHLLELIGFSEDPIVTKNERVYLVRMQIEEPSFLIGKQGDALEALQHVLRLIISRDLDFSDSLLVVDINGYREKKIKNIELRAKELALKVRESGHEIEMPYLNSFERRVVHSIVSTVADVESESRGEGLDRTVVIKLKK